MYIFKRSIEKVYKKHYISLCINFNHRPSRNRFAVLKCLHHSSVKSNFFHTAEWGQSIRHSVICFNVVTVRYGQRIQHYNNCL